MATTVQGSPAEIVTVNTVAFKTFLISHIAWILVAVLSFFVFQSWKSEHDARLLAESETKVAQAQIVSLQQQITARDKQTAATVAPIIKVIHDTTTPAQAIQNLPLAVVSPLPAPVVAQPGGGAFVPQPDLLPIFNQLADDKVCTVRLTTAQSDLADTQKIVAQQTDQIKTLKKKPNFFHRVVTVAKWVGIGIGIGVTVAVVK
jgi:hypothetical protein